MAYLANVKVDNGVLKVYKDGSVISSTQPINYTPTVNTIGYWPLNGNGSDYSGNGKDLTFYGPQSFVDNTKFTGKMSYHNGILNTNAAYGLTDYITHPTNWTYSIWVYPTRVDQGNFFVSSDMTGGPRSNYIGCWMGVDGGNFGGCMVDTWNWWCGKTLQTNNWYNTIITYNGTTYNYYVNNSKGTSFTGTCPSGEVLFYIGGGHPSEYGDGYRSFNGYICEAILENICWSDTDVSNYYTARV